MRVMEGERNPQKMMQVPQKPQQQLGVMGRTEGDSMMLQSQLPTRRKVNLGAQELQKCRDVRPKGSVYDLYVRLSMVTSWRAKAARFLCSCSPYAVPWRHSGNTIMQPYADLQQCTCAREGGAPSLGPAWRRFHAGPNLTSLPSGEVGRISSAHDSNGWRGGWR